MVETIEWMHSMGVAMHIAVNEWAPIHVAARWGSKNTVEYLSKSTNKQGGAQLQAECVNGTLAHHFTANSGHLGLTQQIVSRGLNPLQTDHLGDNMAHQAAACLHPDPAKSSLPILQWLQQY
jgi:ankyrin repeat protein